MAKWLFHTSDFSSILINKLIKITSPFLLLHSPVFCRSPCCRSAKFHLMLSMLQTITMKVTRKVEVTRKVSVPWHSCEFLFWLKINQSYILWISQSYNERYTKNYASPPPSTLNTGIMTSVRRSLTVILTLVIVLNNHLRRHTLININKFLHPLV